MEELVPEFTAITDTTEEQAIQYLTITDNDLAQAIQLFYDHPNLVGTTNNNPPPPPHPQPQARSRPSRHRPYDDDEVITIDDDSDDELGDAEMSESRQPDTVDDEEIARRMQEEYYSNSGVDAEGVRAPIERTTETLVGPGPDYGGEDFPPVVQQQMLERARNLERRRVQRESKWLP